jgi:exopolysaccharide transport family protein
MNVQSPMQDLDGARPEAGEAMGSQIRVSLVDLWQIARIRARVILAAAAAVLVVVTVILFALTPMYTGTAVVMLDPRQNNVVDVQAVLSGLPGDQTTILTQVQILQSENLGSRVIAKLKLDQDPEFNPALKWSLGRFLGPFNPLSWLAALSPPLTPEQQAAATREAVFESFEKKLSVSQVGLSTAIEIDFDSEDPGKAAALANAVSDAYVEDQLNAKFEATQRATQWLSGRLGQLAAAASQAQALVEKYKVDHHLTEVVGATGSGSISVLDQQIAQVNQQLMQAQTDRAAAEATAARVRSLVQSGHAAEVNQVVNSPLIAQLRGQEAQLVEQQAQLASRYGPEHPKMLDLQAEKRDLEAKIGEEISHVVGTSDNDAAVARAHEAVLQDTLTRLESQSGVQGADRVKLAQLQANADSSRSLYDAFVARSKQTQQEEGMQSPDARIISHAAVPLKPSFPKKLIILAITFPASLLFGFMIAFILERLDDGFRVASRAEQVLGLPVFATLPDIPEASKTAPGGTPVTAADLVIDRPLSSFAEAVRGLQMGITLSNVDKAPKVIVLTSAVPGEGKTTTALSLARHIAQTGQKVVIVDADLRRPNIRNIVGNVEVTHDLIDVLRGTAMLDQALVPDPKGPAFILPVMSHVKNAPDLVESNAMAKTIAHLRTAFDYVIIDSAPILPVNDTKILARLADAVVFIVRWEQTPRNAAFDAVKALREVHAPIAGVVLTRADTKRFHYYSFGYGGYYYAYSKYYEDRATA